MAVTIGGYIKVKDVGQGSFGKAILVKDKADNEYILKSIDISRMSSRERSDAINEVKLLSSVKHPYIVCYRESFIEEGQLCIIMDYAAGGDLYKKVQAQRRTGRPFEESQILKWFTQAALALKYLHDKHILHRDIKAQNFFLASDGRLLIGDFGIAKALESTAAFAKTTIGTPYYLSPEICKSQPYSWASDIWSLGCVLFEMCNLHVPFDGPNVKALIDKITRTSAPAITGTYSTGIKMLCADMLQREWRKRPSVADIIQRDVIQKQIRQMLQEEKAKIGIEQSRAMPQENKNSPHIVAKDRAPDKPHQPQGIRSKPSHRPTPDATPVSRSPAPRPVVGKSHMAPHAPSKLNLAIEGNVARVAKKPPENAAQRGPAADRNKKLRP